MRHFALIGRSLTHSYSKSLFDAQGFADADYRLCAMPSLDGLRRWVEEERIEGFNVTNPYKREVIPFLDALSPEAEAIGAVNCVVVVQGRLVGHNTDAPAFRQTLVGIPQLQDAYILGTGGAARAVAYALQQMEVPCTFVSRTPNERKSSHPGWEVVGYEELSSLCFPHSMLLVNATPVGTYPDIDGLPFDLSTLRAPLSTFHCYDLVYNPSPTAWLRQAAALGATTKDGLEMLRLQAAMSWHLWHLEFI